MNAIPPYFVIWKRVIAAIKAFGITDSIYIMGFSPVGYNPVRARNYKRVNQQLIDSCRTNGLYYINMWDSLLKPGTIDTLNPLYTTDNIHPNRTLLGTQTCGRLFTYSYIPTTTGLPDSLTIDTATGNISGYLTDTGTFVIVDTMCNAGGCDTDSVEITVLTDRVPVIIDSAICKVRRATQLDYFRIGDTGTVKFNEIYDSAATCSLWVNRGMTIVAPIIRWYNNVYPAVDSVKFRIPVGTPLNYYYRMKIRNQYGIKNEDPIVHTLFVKGQVR
jgi:hypothetical protein